MKRIVICVAVLLALCCGSALAVSFSGSPELINEAAQSVMMLEVYDEDGEVFATGSGFIAFSNRYLVTNHHVIEDGEYIIAYSDTNDPYYAMEVLAVDSNKDIAILRFFSPTDKKPLTLNEKNDVVRASSVVAIGSPKGFTNSVSIGNVSACFVSDGINYIQFTAPISSGSSGGALFDNEGRVIGITTSAYDDGAGIIQNINFAIDIREVISLYTKSQSNKAVMMSRWAEVDAYIKPTATPTPTPPPTPTPTPTTKPTSSLGGTDIYTYEFVSYPVSQDNFMNFYINNNLVRLGYINNVDNADYTLTPKAQRAIEKYCKMKEISYNGIITSEMINQLFFDVGTTKSSYNTIVSMYIKNQGSTSTSKPKPKTTPTPTPVFSKYTYKFESIPATANNFMYDLLNTCLENLGYIKEKDKRDGRLSTAGREAMKKYCKDKSIAYNGTVTSQIINGLFRDLGVTKEVYNDIIEYYERNIVSLERAQWYDNGNKLQISFQVVNRSASKTIKAVECYIYAVDAWGKKLYGDSYYYWTSNVNVTAGNSAYTDYVNIPDRYNIYSVYCGIKKIRYSDGTIETKDNVYYECWSGKF